MISLMKKKLLVLFFATTWIFLIWKLFIETPEDAFEGSSKVILLWTKFFGEEDYFPSMEGCSVKCHVTTDKNMLRSSAAVVFHLRDTDIKNLPKERYCHFSDCYY